MVSIQVLATPISGLRRAASVNPMALNMERAGARSRPSVIPRLRCFKSMAKDYNRNVSLLKTPERLVIQRRYAIKRSEGPWFFFAAPCIALSNTGPSKTETRGRVMPGEAFQLRVSDGMTLSLESVHAC